MKYRWTILIFSFLLAAASRADFFNDLRKAVEKTAKDTVEDVVISTTQEMVRDMIIGYTSQQTRSDKEVSDEYVKENGSLPRYTVARSYRSELLPGPAVSPGTRVTVRSYIEIIPGNTGHSTRIEEKLTIWDNEDNTIALKSMTKEAGKNSGGAFQSEFSFTLPEGLPQGVYPVTTDLMLDGEISGDQKHQLQLVMWRDGTARLQQIASY